jgi:RNA polymerase sigma-70 factor (ECF subfamily)
MGQWMVSPDTDERQASFGLPGMRDRLWPAALALTRSHQDADDLTQQTMLTLLAKVPDRVTQVAYARRTMLRLWLDEQRSVRRRLRRVAARAWTMPRWHRDTDSASAAEANDRIHEAIDALPQKQRAALVLRLVEGLAYDEIAEALDCNVQTVRANLHLARRRLRRTLEAM